MDKPEQALDFVQDAVSSCGYSLGNDVQIALNCAASEFYDQVSQIERSKTMVTDYIYIASNLSTHARFYCYTLCLYCKSFVNLICPAKLARTGKRMCLCVSSYHLEFYQKYSFVTSKSRFNGLYNRVTLE